MPLKRPSREPLRITLLRRRDYRGHPYNPDRILMRKIDNEEELIDGLRERHPDCVVDCVSLETMDLPSQLALISRTDILVGMHGAGLGFAALLPPWAGVLELFTGITTSRNFHFRNLATWRKLHYAKWVNLRKRYKKTPDRTSVPLAALTRRIDAMLRGMR